MTTEKRKESTINTSSLKLGQPYWIGSKMKSTNMTYLNKEPVTLDDFVAVLYLMLAESKINISKYNTLVTFVEALRSESLTLLPDLEKYILKDFKELYYLCQSIRKIVRLKKATASIALELSKI